MKEIVKIHDFDFSDGVEITPEYTRGMVETVLAAIAGGRSYASISTGNTLVVATKDEEGYIDVNICKNYRRETYQEQAEL